MQKSTVKYPYLTEDVEIYERENGHKIVLAHIWTYFKYLKTIFIMHFCALNLTILLLFQISLSF